MKKLGTSWVIAKNVCKNGKKIHHEEDYIRKTNKYFYLKTPCNIFKTGIHFVLKRRICILRTYWEITLQKASVPGWVGLGRSFSSRKMILSQKKIKKFYSIRNRFRDVTLLWFPRWLWNEAIHYVLVPRRSSKKSNDLFQLCVRLGLKFWRKWFFQHPSLY